MNIVSWEIWVRNGIRCISDLDFLGFGGYVKVFGFYLNVIDVNGEFGISKWYDRIYILKFVVV